MSTNEQRITELERQMRTLRETLEYIKGEVQAMAKILEMMMRK